MGGGRVRVLGNPDQRSQDDSDEGSEFEKPHAGHERGWTLLRRPTYLPECAGFHKSHGEPTFQLLHILTSTMSSLSFLIVCTSRNILLGGIFAGALSLIRRGKGFSFNPFIPTSTCITQQISCLIVLQRQHGCFFKEKDIKTHVDCNDTKKLAGQVLTPLPASFKPLILNDDMDNEWLDMIKNYKTSGRKMKDLQKPKEK